MTDDVRAVVKRLKLHRVNADEILTALCIEEQKELAQALAHVERDAPPVARIKPALQNKPKAEIQRDYTSAALPTRLAEVDQVWQDTEVRRVALPAVRVAPEANISTKFVIVNNEQPALRLPAADLDSIWAAHWKYFEATRAV